MSASDLGGTWRLPARDPLIIGPNLARALRKACGGQLPPGVAVWPALEPHIEIRPGTADRMRLAAECQRTIDAVLSGELRHDG